MESGSGEASFTSTEVTFRRLDKFGRLESEILLVHSSLSGCGYVEGGAPAIVEVLTNWAAGRSVAMPTHTYCYPTTGAPAPVFDVKSTPSVVGAITDYFWRQFGTKRSVHTTHSLACYGPASADLRAGHESCDTPCGKGTPYEKLVKINCCVLMFAANLDTYTLFHSYRRGRSGSRLLV